VQSGNPPKVNLAGTAKRISRRAHRKEHPGASAGELFSAIQTDW
jgi:hypothetical protein